MKVITTSWDDGHPMDFKLAEILSKYNIEATFYIPQRNAEREVMLSDKIVELSKHFEIGGHTLNHVRLNVADKDLINKEVSGSFVWLKDLLGYDPVSFCFPGGKYNKHAVESVFHSGFQVARTTDLLSIRNTPPGKLMSTTLQIYEHHAFTYFRHLAKRRKWINLVKWLSLNAISDLRKLTDAYLNQDSRNPAICLHLWGHSWEIEKYHLWEKLEEILKSISDNPGCEYVQNKDVRLKA